jgi:hypothetical protein
MLEVDTVSFDTLVGEFISSNTLYLLYGFLLMIATYKCQCNKKISRHILFFIHKKYIFLIKQYLPHVFAKYINNLFYVVVKVVWER